MSQQKQAKLEIDTLNDGDNDGSENDCEPDEDDQTCLKAVKSLSIKKSTDQLEINQMTPAKDTREKSSTQQQKDLQQKNQLEHSPHKFSLELDPREQEQQQAQQKQDAKQQEKVQKLQQQQQQILNEVASSEQIKKEDLEKIRKKKIEKQFIEDQKQLDKLLQSDKKPKPKNQSLQIPSKEFDEQVMILKQKIRRHKSQAQITQEEQSSSVSSDPEESDLKSTQVKSIKQIEMLSEREDGRQNRWHYARQLQQSKQLSSDNQDEPEKESEISVNDEILEEDEEEDEDEEDKNNIKYNSTNQLIVEPKKQVQIDAIQQQIQQLLNKKLELQKLKEEEEKQRKIQKEIKKKDKQKKREEEKKKLKLLKKPQLFHWNSYKRILNYSYRQWKILVLAFGFTIGQSYTQVQIPKISGQLLDSTIKEKDVLKLNDLAFNAIFIFLLNALCQFFRTFFMNIVGEKIIIDLKNDCFAMFIKSDVEFHDKQKPGELVSRLTNDIAMARTAASGNLGSFIRNSLICIGNIYVLINMNWRLSIMIIILIPVFIISSAIYGHYCKKISKKYQKFMAKISGLATECFINIRTVKCFTNEQKEIQRFMKKTNKGYKLGQDSSFSLGLYNGVEGLLSNIAILGVLWYGGCLVLEKEMITSGQLASFIMYTSSLSEATSSISASLQKIFTASGACQRVFDLMDTEPKIRYKVGQEVENLQGRIEFTNVSFSYPIAPEVKTIHNITLLIQPGDQVAFVGPSGGGKSTAARLILRFYDINSGSISIDGNDIKSIELKSLRQQIGYVSQEPMLFSGTLKQNICYGVEDYTKSDLEDACRRAFALDFINDKQMFPDGFKTLIGDHGIKLSGGQKQRIAIARALIRKPKIIIFDEATSALDAESEYQVQGAIDDLIRRSKTTIIVIAHKLNTIRHFKKIIIFEAGTIVGQGNHDQLMKSCELYNNLVQLQQISLSTVQRNLDSQPFRSEKK